MCCFSWMESVGWKFTAGLESTCTEGTASRPHVRQRTMPRKTDKMVFICLGLVPQFLVDEPQQRSGQNHPQQLIPVEERESEQLRRGPRIDLRKTQSEKGKEQQQLPGGAVVLRGL